MNTDGNLYALEQHLADEERWDRAEEALYYAREDLSDSLFDAFIDGKEGVIDEVEDYLQLDDKMGQLFKELRAAGYKDMGKIYYKYVAIACNYIASQYDTEEEIERASLDFKL